MSTALMHKLMDVVEATDLDRPQDDFVNAAAALLALAISKLDPAEREEALQSIEDGALRRGVEKFPGCRSPAIPEEPYGPLQ